MTETLTNNFKPMLQAGMLDADYRAMPYLSHSGLKDYVRGQAMPKTRRLLIGTALHTLVLEGSEAYGNAYHECMTEYKLTTKEGKSGLKEMEADVGKTVLRPSEYRLVGSMAQALAQNEWAAKAIQAEGENELCVVAKPEGCQTVCKGLLDMKRRGCIADIKTTGYRDRNEFKSAIVDYGYASQAAFYIDLYAAVTGEYLPFVFICVSKDTLEVWVERISNEHLAFGRRWYQDVLALYEREKSKEPAPF